MTRAKGSAQMRGHLGAETAKQSNSSTNYEAIRSLLQSGRDFRLRDFGSKRRAVSRSHCFDESKG